MDLSSLAALEHENWIAYLAASISMNEHGLVVREHGIATLLGHVPMRFFNQILVEEPDATASSIEKGVAIARERGDPFAVSLRGGIDDRFKALMADLGLAAFDRAATQAMTLHPVGQRAKSAKPEAGFEIQKVTDEAGLEEHRRIVTDAFGADPSVEQAMLGVGLFDYPECAVYVGYLDGAPVTAGLGWQTGRTIGVYNIATLPTARQRGFGEAMTARVLADGEAAGCDVAALQTSSMGRPIYERLGFRLSVRYTGYVDESESGR